MSQSYSADHSAAFDQMLDQMKAAGQDFVNGDPVPMMELWSTAADVSILGEGGGYGLGWEQVGPILMAGSALFTSGHSPTRHPGNAYAPGSGPPVLDGSGQGHIDTGVVIGGISPGGDVAYTVGIERGEAYVLGDEEPRAVALRVTTLYRWEAGRWKIVHRHADDLVESN